MFGVETGVLQNGGNAAQRREYDRRIGAGTMSRTGATCPCCGGIMTMEDIRLEGRVGRLGAVMTAVVVDGLRGKEYRLPSDHEREAAQVNEEQLKALYADIPFGLPEEPLPSKEALGFRVPLYGFDTWRKLFTNRQLLALGEFVLAVRELRQILENWPEDWNQAIRSNLILVADRLADYSSGICSWHNSGEKIRNTFSRFALPIVWDYTEVNLLSDTSGNFIGALEWVSRFIGHALQPGKSAHFSRVQANSAARLSGEFDVILTDPPYYDAIPYSDCMDFFHVWLRRTTNGLCQEVDTAFRDPIGAQMGP